MGEVRKAPGYWQTKHAEQSRLEHVRSTTAKTGRNARTRREGGAPQRLLNDCITIGYVRISDGFSINLRPLTYTSLLRCGPNSTYVFALLTTKNENRCGRFTEALRGCFRLDLLRERCPFVHLAKAQLALAPTFVILTELPW